MLNARAISKDSFACNTEYVVSSSRLLVLFFEIPPRSIRPYYSVVHVLLRRAYQTALDLRSGPSSQLVSWRQRKTNAQLQKAQRQAPSHRTRPGCQGLEPPATNARGWHGAHDREAQAERECLAAGVGGPGKAGSLLLCVSWPRSCLILIGRYMPQAPALQAGCHGIPLLMESRPKVSRYCTKQMIDCPCMAPCTRMK